MSDELKDMIQGFVEDSHEAFDSIENDLLSFESNPEDLSIINGIFRVMHTIKGTAGFLGLDDIGKLAHKLESIFDRIRREELQITSELMDTLLPAIDLLKLMVFELLEETKSPYHFEATLQTLNHLEDNDFPSESQDFEGKHDEAESLLEEDSFFDDVKEIQEEVDDSGFALEEDGSFAITPQLLQDFVVEAEEHLVVIEENLLALETNPTDSESINELFRAIHSIKGTADYVRLIKITRLSHKIETLFERMRKGVFQYTNNIADVVLKAVDLLRTLVFMVKMGDQDDIINIDEILAQLSGLLHGKEKEEKPKVEKKIEPKVEKTQAVEEEKRSETNVAAKDKAGTTTAKSKVGKNFANALKVFLNVCLQQLMVIEKLGSLLQTEGASAQELSILHRAVITLKGGANRFQDAEVIRVVLQLEKHLDSVFSGDVEQQAIGGNFSQLTEQLSKRIVQVKNGEYSPASEVAVETDIANLPTTTEGTDLKEDEDGSTSVALPKDSEIKTMRVEANRLDTFMNLIAELIITRNTFNHLFGEMGTSQIQPSLLQGLKTVEDSFNRISDELQNTLMEMRLIPVKTVFQKIPRIVRDIARKTEKKIQVQLIGEATEIDKSIVEIIGDPLVHIIRNSCDHGIETVQERIDAGKPETGTVILKATHTGSAIEIDIIDDGAGINTASVKRSAIKKGMLSQEDADKLDEKAINNFIFKPGFSTASKVTDLSGRGVGMDVVLTNIQRVHGSVEVESEQGIGCKIKIRLPLSLAVIDALIISCQNQKFAIPLDTVEETMEVKVSDLQRLKHKEAIDLRGKIIGVARLQDLLELGGGIPEEDHVLSIVFVKVGSIEIGIAVDDLHNQQEIVVKPLQGVLIDIPGIKGSTLLGNGEIILILDPGELMQLATA